MPKHPNNRPWAENLAYDFNLPAISPTDAEGFIDSLATSHRNKEFLRLRYRDGKTYTEIAAAHGMTPPGVRLAIIAMQEKFRGEAASAAAPSPVPATPSPAATTPPQAATTPPPAATTPPPAVSTPPPAVSTPHPADNNATKESSRPLSINLAAIRRFLGLTPEEFARPLPIEDGDSLITRLETGFSRASSEIVQLLCEAWGISKSYLLTGHGEMFEAKGDYCSVLTTLLKTYLSVATFNHKGQQYWKRSLVDDLGRLIDVGKLNGREMCRVVRTLYDFLDVEQFGELLERMGQ